MGEHGKRTGGIGFSGKDNGALGRRLCAQGRSPRAATLSREGRPAVSVARQSFCTTSTACRRHGPPRATSARVYPVDRRGNPGRCQHWSPPRGSIHSEDGGQLGQAEEMPIRCIGRHLFATAFAGYIRWLAPAYEDRQKSFSSAVERSRDEIAEHGSHKRSAENLAQLETAFGTWCEYALHFEAISKDEALDLSAKVHQR